MMSGSEKVFKCTAAVGGFHFFRSTWIPREEEIFICHYLENNVFDVYAIKPVTESNQIVGHLPREICRITKFLLDRGAKISLTFTPNNYRRSPLVQGGLEIPCKVTVKLPATIKNHMILGRYEQFVR